MPQKYKVFFNHNKLFIAKKSPSKIDFANTFINPDKESISSLVRFLLNDDGTNNYLIKTDSLKKTWQVFCSLFEIRKAAGGLVINDKNESLFIKRRGFWDLPKGHLEKGEKNREAAIREVEEECGINNLKIECKLVKTYHIYPLKKAIVLKPTKWYLMSHSGKAKLSPQTKEGITEVVWADEKDQKKMIKNSFPSIIEVVKKAQKIESLA